MKTPNSNKKVRNIKEKGLSQKETLMIISLYAHRDYLRGLIDGGGQVINKFVPEGQRAAMFQNFAAQATQQVAEIMKKAISTHYFAPREIIRKKYKHVMDKDLKEVNEIMKEYQRTLDKMLEDQGKGRNK